MSNTLIQTFLLKYMETLGHTVVETEPGVYVMAPAIGAPVELTFDSEAAAEKPSRQLVAFGSPLLDSALSETLAAGRVLHLYAPARPVDSALVEQRLRARLTLDRVRLLGLEPGRLIEGRIFKVQFVVSIHGDVVQQVACPVWIDGTSGLSAERYSLFADRLSLQDARQFVLPLDAEAGVERMVATSLAELQRLTQARLTSLASELALQQQGEVRRVRAYFRQREDELAARAKRSHDPSSRSAQTLAAVVAERDMRLHEIEARYRPRVEARVAAVEVLHVPRYQAGLLVQMGSQTLRLPVRYEAVLGVVELPACPSCGEPADTLIGRRDCAKPGCGHCLRESQASPIAFDPTPVKAASPPPEPPCPPRARPSERVAAKPAPRPAPEEFDRLLISTDFWVLVARTMSRTASHQFPRIGRVSDRIGGDLLRALDAGWGEPPLEVHPKPRTRGGLRGRGLLTLLADPLLATDERLSYDVDLFEMRAGDCLRAGRFDSPSRLLRGYGDPVMTGTALRVHGVGHHLRVLLTFRIGSPAALDRTRVHDLSLEENVVGVLRRELGLTAAGDDLWLVLKTSILNHCILGGRQCQNLLRQIDRGERVEAAELRRRLVEAARPWASSRAPTRG